MLRRFPPGLSSLCAVCCFVGLIAPLWAQAPRAKQQHETLLLDIDNAATKKFATVQTHLRVGQLPEAIELLRSISDGHVGKLVATTPGRYVNVQIYVQMLAAGLPPEGLKIYRQQLDPVLKPSFETGRDTADEVLLLKVLQQGYCCSFADDALLLLGDLAWDAGDVWRARSFWEQILPPPRPKALGEPVTWLAYPDSDLDLGMILARLILCTIHSGDRLEIERELAVFAERYPDAEGRLAGRQGNLSTILKAVAAAAEEWPVSLQTSVVETFGGSPQRYHVDTEAAELGALRWQADLRSYGEEQRRGFQPGSIGGLSYFPVVYGDVVLVNDDEYIRAYRLQTGQPAWSDDATDAKIYTSGFATQVGTNLPRAFGDGPVGNIGLPRFTMTVADGRLYARMGSVQPYTNERSGLLVCLDLAHGEGKPVWETFASTIEPETGGWNFEGSPLVVGSRVYVGMRRLNPQPQANVACFDSLTGKLIWNRKLCVGQTNPNFQEFDVNQHLLTWGEGTLYYATHMGGIAALDPSAGTIKWIVSYPRVDDTKLRHEFTARLQRGPLPAMFADGTLYVAPIDSDELLAFEAETGLLKWKRSFNRPIQALLGVSKGMMFVSGAELWGVAVDSGKVVWKIGDSDPESHGFGRGLMVEDLLYWPTHEEIFVVDQATGAIKQRLPLFAVHGQYGGNLLLTDHYLLVAQPNRLAVFSDHGPAPQRSKNLKPHFTRRQAPAARAWHLARVALETRDWGKAADQFQAASQLARPGDEWMGRPLAAVASDRAIDARLREAWQLTQSDPTVAPDRLKVAFDAAAKRETAARNPGLQFGGDDSSERGRSQLLTPRSTPVEMVSWITAQVVARKEANASANVTESVPVLEETSEYHDVFRRIRTSHYSPVLHESASAQAISAAEDLLKAHPHQALRRLRELSTVAHSNDDRGRAWCGIARGLESQQAWHPAAAAWNQAARHSSDQLVTELDRQISIGELVRERLAQPQYVAQSILTANEAYPWPLRRRWEFHCETDLPAVYPVGIPPSLETACVLVDRSPLTCLNLFDGTPRWQLQLSHPVLWAGFAAEKLILGSAVEVRAVSVTTGETVWLHRAPEGAEESDRPSHQIISVHFNSGSRSPGTATGHPLHTSAGALRDFALVGDILLARQGTQDIVAWNVDRGQLAWQLTASRGLSNGWGLSAQHVVIGQLAPDTVVFLNPTNGSEVARFPTDSANWLRPPTLRADGTLVTVGPLGRIETWSKPGYSWTTDAGPRAWTWQGPISQSNLYPEVLSYGRISLIVMDGKMLIAVDSLQGNILWKAYLGQSLIEDARSAIQFVDDRVYVAADGILRALGLQDGALIWERYLGDGNVSWHVRTSGTTVMAYPNRTGPSATESKITVCDAATGAYLQRLSLSPDQSTVQAFPTTHTTLVACGGRLTGLGE